MTNKCIVYGLVASDEYLIRYVGQTRIGARRRLQGHISASRKSPKQPVEWWVRSVHQRGHSVRMVILEQNAVWDEAEIRHIAFHRELGAKLLNLTVGGRGCPGRKFTKEDRIKLSICIKDAWARNHRSQPPWTDEHRENHREACKRRGGAYQIGRKQSEETKTKKRVALLGRRFSEETISKMKASSAIRWARVKSNAIHA